MGLLPDPNQKGCYNCERTEESKFHYCTGCRRHWLYTDHWIGKRRGIIKI